MAKDKRGHDQKRKAEVAGRARRERRRGPQPYAGAKCQAPEWVPHGFETEKAVYEAIL